MALGDDTGCSTADHLHFSTKLNDIAFDPYAGNTNWVSGSPIPMGFRDQNNNERGSFNLDNTKIHDKWVGLEGSPGAPTEDDGTYSCPTFGNDPDGALTATLYYQRFQWGEIEYCGTAAATYTAYPRTYLPDVSSAYASNYWGSVVSTRSNTIGCNEISLNMLYSSDGKVADSRGYYPCMDQRKLWSFDVSNLRSYTPSPLWERNDFQHNSGAIASILDVAAIVRGNKNNDTEQTAYSGVLTSGGSAGWEQVGTELFAPIIKRDYYNRTSSIDVVNTESSDTTTTVYYYNSASGEQWNQSVILKPNAKTTFTPSGSHGSAGCSAVGQICSARITANQPLAAVVREYNTADGLVVSTHNIYKTSTARTIYFPVMKYRYYEMTTGLTVQNISSGYASYIQMYYFNYDGTPMGCSTTAYNVPPYAHVVFYDGPCLGDNFLGTAIATSNQSIVGVAHEASISGTQDRKKTYSAILYGDQSNWKSGIAAMNTAADYYANVTVSYYNTDGTLHSTVGVDPIPPRGIKSISPPSGFTGSAVISSNHIAVVVNIVNKATSGDTHAMYNASIR